MASTHTPAALPSTDLAMGLVLWLLGRGCSRRRLSQGHRPPCARGFAPSATTGLAARLRPRELAGVSAALLAGSASHLIWDAFTHPDGWGTRHLPVLREPWHGMAGYLWAQYASDVAGALVLATWVALWWRRTPPAPRPRVVAGSTARSTATSIAGSSPGGRRGRHSHGSPVVAGRRRLGRRRRAARRGSGRSAAARRGGGGGEERRNGRSARRGRRVGGGGAPPGPSRGALSVIKESRPP